MGRGRIGVPMRSFYKLPIPRNLIREAEPNPRRGEVAPGRLELIEQRVMAAYSKFLLGTNSPRDVAAMLGLEESFVLDVHAGRKHRGSKPLQPPAKLLRRI